MNAGFLLPTKTHIATTWLLTWLQLGPLKRSWWPKGELETTEKTYATDIEIPLAGSSYVSAPRALTLEWSFSRTPFVELAANNKLNELLVKRIKKDGRGGAEGRAIREKERIESGTFFCFFLSCFPTRVRACWWLSLFLRWLVFFCLIAVFLYCPFWNSSLFFCISPLDLLSCCVVTGLCICIMTSNSFFVNGNVTNVDVFFSWIPFYFGGCDGDELLWGMCFVLKIETLYHSNHIQGCRERKREYIISRLALRDGVFLEFPF